MGRLEHSGNPGASLVAEDNSIEKDTADNWKLSKKKKSRERIDGIVALIMGLERATCGPAPVLDFYESHDLEIG